MIEWQDENGNMHSGEVVASKNNFDIIDCQQCGFKHAVPLPTVDEVESFYKDKYYEQESKIDYAEKQKEQEKWWSRIYKDRCAKFKNILGASGRILDIGCGPGFFMNEAQKQGWESTGMEPSKKSSEYASNTLGLNVHNVSIESMTDCNFTENYFDVIYSHGVLEHMRQPDLFFSNAKKYLKNGGLIFYSVANDFSLIQKVMLEHNNMDPWWVVPPEHLNYFDKLSAERIAKKNGFDIISGTSTFPIDIFLLMGENYIMDKSLGPIAHNKIEKFEESILNSTNKNLLSDMYKKFYEIGIGRQLEIIARNKL